MKLYIPLTTNRCMKHKKTGSVKLRVLNFILGFAVICGFWIAGQATRTPDKEAYANILRIAFLPIWLTSSGNNYCNDSGACGAFPIFCDECFSDPDNVENNYNVNCDCAEDCGCATPTPTPTDTPTPTHTPTPDCGDNCSRCSTPSEDADYFPQSDFPNLSLPACIVCEPNTNENCAEYAIGETPPVYPNSLSNVTNYLCSQKDIKYVPKVMLILLCIGQIQITM